MKSVLYGIFIMTLLFSSACTASVDAPEGKQPMNYNISEIQRDLNPLADAQQLQSLANGNTQFGLNFYHHIQAQEGNIIFSPLSLSLALSMTLAGAEGDTRADMLQALSLAEVSGDPHVAFNALLQAIEASQKAISANTGGDAFQLNIANSIWGNAGTVFKQDFLDTLARNYGAGIYSVDYEKDPEAARQLINAWIEDETSGKIPKLIGPGAIDAMTRLVLANAIYFNGSWLHPFTETLTEKAPFTLLDGSQVQVDMMQLKGEDLAYARMDGYQLLSLPYLSSDFSMLLLVPHTGNFAEVESHLSVDMLSDGLGALSSRPVSLALPKFDFESTINANDVLIALGMGSAFGGKADFSGMTAEEQLYISDVLHKATITVDEKGTEAAAATAVIMKRTSIQVEDPLSLLIDRPFIFSIVHNPTGTVLFMGRVLKP